MSCVKLTGTSLTCTTERRPVIITRRLGSWVNARDPAITLNTAYTNKPNADTRSRMSFRSLCSSARNLRLWTLSIHKYRYQTLYRITVHEFTGQVKSLQHTTKWSECLTFHICFAATCACVWCFSKQYAKKISQIWITYTSVKFEILMAVTMPVLFFYTHTDKQKIQFWMHCHTFKEKLVPFAIYWWGVQITELKMQSKISVTMTVIITPLCAKGEMNNFF